MDWRGNPLRKDYDWDSGECRSAFEHQFVSENAWRGFVGQGSDGKDLLAKFS